MKISCMCTFKYNQTALFKMAVETFAERMARMARMAQNVEINSHFSFYELEMYCTNLIVNMTMDIKRNKFVFKAK